MDCKDVIREIRESSDRLKSLDSGECVFIPKNEIGIITGKYSLGEVAKMIYFLADMLE